MLALASRVAGSLGVPVHAVLVGGDAVDAANALGGHGVSVAHVIEHPQLERTHPSPGPLSLGEVIAALGAVASSRRAASEGPRCLPTSPRGAACRWPRT